PPAPTTPGCARSSAPRTPAGSRPTTASWSPSAPGTPTATPSRPPAASAPPGTGSTPASIPCPPRAAAASRCATWPTWSAPPSATDTQRLRRRSTGGEVDGISRQLARYVQVIGRRHVPNVDVWLVYRLDRFGRGGDHTAFADLGFAAVRITEAHENYTRQHQ